MRFSATEQIIRDAEQQEAGGAVTRVAAPPQKPAEAAPSPTARDLFKVQQAQPAFDLDFDIEDLGSGGDDDEEGATLVDTERAAAALQEMRSYGGSRIRPPSNDIAARSPVPTPTLRWAGGVPPGRPAARGPWETAALEARTSQEVQRASSSFSATAAPATTPAPTPLDFMPPARGTVGRRVGILIAAATAAVVALGIGAWTRSGRDTPSAGPSAARTESAPRGPVSAVIVPTPAAAPEVPSEPAAPVIEPPPPVLAGSAEAADSAADVSPAPPIARAKHAPAKVGKARTSRKQVANKARRSKRHAAKVVASRAQSKRVIVAAPPAPVRAQVPIRSLSDPDATLPITD